MKGFRLARLLHARPLTSKRGRFYFAQSGKDPAPDAVDKPSAALSAEQLQASIRDQVNRHYDSTMQSLKPPEDDLAVVPSLSEVLERLDAPAVLEMDESHKDLMIQNPLESKEYILTNQHSMLTAEDLTIRVAENPLLGKILTERQFDIKDPSIEITQTADSQLFFDPSSNFKSVSLGNAVVFPKDTVYLDDLDVDNIPKNLSIQLFKETKEFVAVGKEIAGDEAQAADGLAKDVESVDAEMFVEKSLRDVQREELNPLELFFLAMDPGQVAKTVIKLLPLFVFMYFLLESHAELSYAKHGIHAIDEQKVKGLVQMKQKHIRDSR